MGVISKHAIFYFEASFILFIFIHNFYNNMSSFAF